MVPGIDQIVNLIAKSCQDPFCVPPVLKASIGLLGDLGATYGGRMHQIFAQPLVLQLLQESAKYDGMEEITKYTQRIIQQVGAGKA